MPKYQITISVPDRAYIENADDLRDVLEKECNLWSVTHCNDNILISEVPE